MLVDRPAVRASCVKRALLWAAGVLGLGLGAIVVMQLLAEPAGAETPRPVGGVVGAAERVVQTVATAPAGAAGPTTNAAAPVADALEPAAKPAGDAVAPATDPPVDAVEPAVPPVVEAPTPVVDGVAPAVAPVVPPVAEAVAPVATPVAEAADRVVGPVVAPDGQPVVDAGAAALTPIVETVTPAVAPVLEFGNALVDPLVGGAGSLAGPLLGGAPGPLPDRPDRVPSSPGDRPPSPIRARRGPLPVAGPWSLLGADGRAAISVLRSTIGASSGGVAPASGVPPGPPASAVPPGVPGALGGSAPGGNAGPWILLAVLAGGLAQPGLARGGVVRDDAARLTGLVHAPGRLPG
jgi:hypothetical protein